MRKKTICCDIWLLTILFPSVLQLKNHKHLASAKPYKMCNILKRFDTLSQTLKIDIISLVCKQKQMRKMKKIITKYKQKSPNLSKERYYAIKSNYN